MGTRKSKYFIPSNFTFTTRLAANRFLGFATFGAATARTNLATSTKISVIPLAAVSPTTPTGLEEDDAVRLMRLGVGPWLDEQLADTSPKLALGFIHTDAIDGGANNQPIRQIFWTELMHGTAQVRLKTAYALSQIFVVNTLANAGGGGVPFDHKYYDNLVKATLSNSGSTFRALLTDVVYSVTMGRMLTYINNKRASGVDKPDQNFIRELFQLMCPGLFHQNMDGTFNLDANGVKRQTFLPSQMELLAGAITGMGDNQMVVADVLFSTTDGRRLYEDSALATFDAIVLPALLDGTVTTIPAKLMNAARLSDEPPVGGYVVLGNANLTTTSFQVTTTPSSNGNVVTDRPFSYRLTNDFSSVANRIDATVTLAGSGTTATITRRNASNVAIAHGLVAGNVIFSKGNIRETLDSLMDWCFNHPSTPPFFAKAMIKHFVTSNPTPDYVRRVANVFVDNGSLVRGDIAAVVKAILSDKEALFDYGVNPNNHGRQLTIPEKIGRVARAFRCDNVHIHNDTNKFIAGSAGAVFTKPLINADYAPCAVYNTGSFRPYESPSIFNFCNPDFQPKGEILGDLDKFSPESQIVVSGSKIQWQNMVTQLCDTQMPTTAFGNEATDQPLNISFNSINNPTGNKAVSGFDFTPPATLEVTVIAGNDVTLRYTTASTTTSTKLVAFRARRNASGLSHQFFIGMMPTGTAGTPLVSTTFFVTDGGAGSYVVGDIVTVDPLIITGYAGFPGRRIMDTGNQPRTITWHPYNILFHSVCNAPITSLISLEAVVLPTEIQLMPTINYIESILMTRPISAEIKAIMVQAGQVPRTAIAPFINGNTAYLDNFKHVVMSRAQLRARAMVAMLLASPEYASLR